MNWSSHHEMQAHGAQMRDRLMQSLREAHSPRPGQKVVSFKARNATSLQRYLEETLLDEPVQIYFTTDATPMLAGLPISMAVDQACAALRVGSGRPVQEALDGEVKTALIALQMFDAAINTCSPPVHEPRIEVLLNDTLETVGLRIPQQVEAVIVTPGTFIHATFNFAISEAVSHPGSWFRLSDEAVESELLN